jgi:hypothetical protein
MQLDRVATDIVLRNIRQAVPSRRPAMARELRLLLSSDEYRGRVPRMYRWPVGERGNILLFVRERRKQDGRTMPYTFLGPADCVSHKGERPIAFVWRLRRPMPAALFRDAKVAAGL